MQHTDNRPTGGYSRRRFLGTVGASTAAAVAAAATTLPGIDAAALPAPPPPGRFGRLFTLPPFAQVTPAMIAALQELGKPGGLLDANDPLDKGAKALIADPALSQNNRDNPTNTAGTTFFAQFMDHDITFDPTSPMGVPTPPEAAPNARTPAFDLDSVYAAGPVASPQYYLAGDMIKLRLESGGLYEDLPRTENGVAIINDPRNDETMMLAGLYAAVVRFHNHAVELVRSQQKTAAPADVFAAARQLTTWHYHWLIVHEFLPQFIGQDMVAAIFRRGRRYFLPPRGQAFIPIEFAGAAYRFGHSMARPSYRANLAGDRGEPFFGLLFDPSQNDKADPGDMRGGFRAPRRFIDWQTFFDFGDGEVKRNKRMDTQLSTPLFNLPLGAIASHDHPTSLATRDLLRHLTWSLPSGQAIARVLDVPPLAPADLDELQSFGVGLEQSTPLWYYVLKEAEVVADGLHLGPVGGTIVGETIIGLLRTDPASWVLTNPQWRPTLPSRAGSSDFRMVDFLTFAGVDPASRRQSRGTDPSRPLAG